MLTREIMGLGALAILWINTLLISGAAWKEVVRLLARRRELVGVVRGTVMKGAGEHGAFASDRVEQTGHGNGEAKHQKAILFHDRSHAGEVFGGTLRVDGEELEIPAVAKGEVWLPLAALKERAARFTDAEFEAAFVHAKRAKGHARTVIATIDTGTEVWAAKDGSFVSTLDPRALCTKYVLLAIASIVGFLAGAAVCTFLALQAPLFGITSIVGAVLGLAFFITVQPAGTMLRDAVRLPNTAFVRGDWILATREPAAATDVAPSPAEPSPGE